MGTMWELCSESVDADMCYYAMRVNDKAISLKTNEVQSERFSSFPFSFHFAITD